jgi:hypothetical protein
MAMGAPMRLYPDAVTQYINDPASGLNTESSRTNYRKTLRALQAAHPNHTIQDFTETELVAFCGRAHLSPATRAAYRTRINSFYTLGS